MAATDVIAQLAVNLSMETATFERGATRAEARARKMGKNFDTIGGRITGGLNNGVKGFAAGLAGAFTVGALFDLAKGGLAYASSLGEVSQQLGVTSGDLQRFRYAATQTGIEEGEMDKALAKLSRTIGEAGLGSKTATAAFEQLGISVKDSAGNMRSTGELMPLIAEKLKGIHDPAQKAAILVDLFGKNGQKMLPLLSEGAAGVDKLTTAADRLGIVMSEKQIKAADDAADKWAQYAVILKSYVAIAVVDVIESFGNLGNKTLQLGKYLNDTKYAFIRMVDDSVAAVGRMITEIAASFARLPGVMVAKAKAAAEATKAAFFDMWTAVTRRSYVPDMVQDIANEMSRLQEVLVDPSLHATEKVGAAFQALSGTIGGLFGRKAGGLLSSIGQLVGAVAPLFGSRTLALSGSGSSSIDGASILASQFTKRAAGGPVVPGRTYMVGERGPEYVRFGSRGYVTPNRNTGGSASRIQVIPSAYFDVVVDGRVQKGAAPMAGQAAVMGARGGVAAMQHRASRRIP